MSQMWTAQFVDVVKDAGQLRFTIVYSDGVTKVAREYRRIAVTDAVLREIARADVADISAAQQPVVLTVTPGSLIDLTPPSVVPVTPTKAEQSQINWIAALENARKCQRGLTERIPGFDQARLDKAIADRDALWDVAYEAFV